MSECNKELKKRTEHCFDHSPEAAADAEGRERAERLRDRAGIIYPGAEQEVYKYFRFAREILVAAARAVASGF
jgi:hypothetical protein